MTIDPRELYAERVSQVSGLLRGIENLAEVAAILSSAENESVAIERLSSALGLDAHQCRPIIDMRLGQLLPAHVEMARREIADLLAYLDETHAQAPGSSLAQRGTRDDPMSTDFQVAVDALRALDGEQVIVVVQPPEWNSGLRPYRGRLGYETDLSTGEVAMFRVEEPHDPRWANPGGIAFSLDRAANIMAERCGGPAGLGVSVVQDAVRISVYPVTEPDRTDASS